MESPHLFLKQTKTKPKIGLMNHFSKFKRNPAKTQIPVRRRAEVWEPQPADTQQPSPGVQTPAPSRPASCPAASQLPEAGAPAAQPTALSGSAGARSPQTPGTHRLCCCSLLGLQLHAACDTQHVKPAELRAQQRSSPWQS